MNYDNTVKENTLNEFIADVGIENQFLTFAIEDEEYGIEIENIKEIIVMCSITEVPHTQSFLKGIINLRGEIIPVIDVRERFGKQSREYDSLTCIIVIEYNDYNMGLIVDRVKEVMYINGDRLTFPPSDRYNYYNQFIKNIGKINDEVKQILDLDKLLMQ